MTQETLSRLLEAFAQGRIAHLEYAQGDSRLVLDAPAAPGNGPAVVPAAPVPAAAPAPAPAPEKGATIDAPLVGTFYTASSPDAQPFVQVGDRVKKGQTVCILEAMKMINEIPAPRDCVIEEVLVQNQALVGFGDPLFRVREL